MKMFVFWMYIILMILFIISIFYGQNEQITIFGVLVVLTYLQFVEYKIDEIKNKLNDKK